MTETTIQIHGLFDQTGFRPNTTLDPPPYFALTDADLIIGRDTMSQNEFIVYGRDALRAIVADYELDSLAKVFVELDQETDDLERLIALVLTLKGSHDYQSYR